MSLKKWFNEKWVDIGSPKKGGGYKECGRKSASGSKRKYPKCVPAAKATSDIKAIKQHTFSNISVVTCILFYVNNNN